VDHGFVFFGCLGGLDGAAGGLRPALDGLDLLAPVLTDEVKLIDRDRLPVSSNLRFLIRGKPFRDLSLDLSPESTSKATD
jgi:hypothetical protein